MMKKVKGYFKTHTTISISFMTLERLNRLGERGKSHDLFINELLDRKEGKGKKGKKK